MAQGRHSDEYRRSKVLKTRKLERATSKLEKKDREVLESKDLVKLQVKKSAPLKCDNGRTAHLERQKRRRKCGLVDKLAYDSTKGR